jgi:hypothetical protein
MENHHMSENVMHLLLLRLPLLNCWKLNGQCQDRTAGSP